MVTLTSLIQNLPSKGSLQFPLSLPLFFLATHTSCLPQSVRNPQQPPQGTQNFGSFALWKLFYIWNLRHGMVTFGEWILHSAQFSWDLSAVCVLVACAFHGWAVFHGMETPSSAESWPTDSCLLLLPVPNGVAVGVHVQVLGENMFITTLGQMPRVVAVGSYDSNMLSFKRDCQSGLWYDCSNGMSYTLSTACFCHWCTITNISPIKNFSLQKIFIFKLEN